MENKLSTDQLLSMYTALESRVDRLVLERQILAVPNDLPSVPSMSGFLNGFDALLGEAEVIDPITVELPFKAATSLQQQLVEQQKLIKQLEEEIILEREKSNRFSAIILQIKQHLRLAIGQGRIELLRQYAPFDTLSDSQFADIFVLQLRRRFSTLGTLEQTQKNFAQQSLTQKIFSDFQSPPVEPITPPLQSLEAAQIAKSSTSVKRVLEKENRRPNVNAKKILMTGPPRPPIVNLLMSPSPHATVDSSTAQIYASASEIQDPGDAASFLLARADSSNLFLRLVACNLLEQAQNVSLAEETYFALLEAFSSAGKPCPAGLFQYLSFVARSRSLDEALTIFEDMFLAESEHITPGLIPAVAVDLCWAYGQKDTSAITQSANLFRKGLSRYAKNIPISAELTVRLAKFLAYQGNQFQSSQLELAKFVSSIDPTVSLIWSTWERILIDFNANVETIKSMHGMRKMLNSGGKSKFQRSTVSSTYNITEDSITPGMVTISDFPDFAAFDSWLLWDAKNFAKAKNIFSQPPSIQEVRAKLLLGDSCVDSSTVNRSPSLPVESAILECLLSAEQISQDPSSQLASHDGGDGPTNHTYRPDVTKMLKFSPWEIYSGGAVGSTSSIVAIPKVLTNLISILPSNIPLKCANNQYIADQCIRLLVSIALPSRHIGEDSYSHVDKRSRAAVEARIGSSKKPTSTLRSTAVATSVSQLVAAADKKLLKVKKEELFDHGG